jgi:hypothetical protein
MDELVAAAMLKWPHVPSCYGWLGLDARGQWWMRDEAAQSAGRFQSGVPATKGSLLRHEKLIAFIARNYQQDARGCWYFQNGPQQVFVELEATPHILRIQASGSMETHTGEPFAPRRAWTDGAGRLYFDQQGGELALVHSLDVLQGAELIERWHWPTRALPDSARADSWADLELAHFVCSPEWER